MAASTPQDETSLYQAFTTQSWFVTAATALYCYEWLATFDQEVDKIWGRKWSWFTWVYAMNRYAMLCTMIVQLVPTNTHSSCVLLNQLIHALLLLQLLSSALFTGMRVYALSSRNIWLSSFAFLCGLFPVFSNMAVYIKVVPLLTSPIPGDNRCELYDPLSQTALTSVTLVTRIVMILSDIVALQVTWRRTIGVIRAKATLGPSFTFSKAIFRDGIFFFLMLVILNIIQVLYNTVPSFLSLAFAGSFFIPCSSIVVCRFMISIRQAAELNESSNNASRFSAFRFDVAAFAGTIEDEAEAQELENGDADPNSDPLQPTGGPGRHNDEENQLGSGGTGIPSEFGALDIVEESRTP